MITNICAFCSMFSIIVLAVVLCSLFVSPNNSATIPDQDSGYVDVRPGAHMFWWLYGSSDSTSRDQKPLVMWLQGGPGGSSTGFGNFEEIGPLDVDLNPRNTTWIQSVNVLFVDNPVGTGYSYVDETNYLTKNVTEIANDLITLIEAFARKYHIFQELPFYVFCESYGGKMTATFGVALLDAIKGRRLSMNFKGVALGDGWVSPMDSIATWGPFLYATSLINQAGLDKLQALVDQAQKALDEGNGTKATAIWGQMENVVENITDNVDFYNILNNNENSESIVNSERYNNSGSYVSRVHADRLAELMNGKIKRELKIPAEVIWGDQSGKVFAAQSEDFMKDVISDVDSLLSSGIKVVVYSGQLDLIVDTLGTLKWIEKLKWNRLPDFLKAPRKPLYPPSGVRSKETGAFVQNFDNLYFYWILKAGHMVPRDAGEMALTMLEIIVKE